MIIMSVINSKGLQSLIWDRQRQPDRETDIERERQRLQRGRERDKVKQRQTETKKSKSQIFNQVLHRSSDGHLNFTRSIWWQPVAAKCQTCKCFARYLVGGKYSYVWDLLYGHIYSPAVIHKFVSKKNTIIF